MIKNLLVEFLLLKQMPEGQNCCLIRDPITYQIYFGKMASSLNLYLRIFHSPITDAVPLCIT